MVKGVSRLPRLCVEGRDAGLGEGFLEEKYQEAHGQGVALPKRSPLSLETSLRLDSAPFPTELCLPHQTGSSIRIRAVFLPSGNVTGLGSTSVPLDRGGQVLSLPGQRCSPLSLSPSSKARCSLLSAGDLRL